MKLIATILCPSRKVVEKKYGTCPMPVLFSDYIHDENTLKLLLNDIPRIYHKNKNSIHLLILGNIEGVMDIFNRGRKSNLKDWFQHNNVFQTFDLLRIGISRKEAVSTDKFEIDKLNAISNNLYFISANDFLFTDNIKIFLPEILNTKSSITEIVSFFYNNPEKYYSDSIDKARKELEIKCPKLDKISIEEQTKFIRYALRRAIGVFLDAIHKYFKTSELLINSAFEPEGLDVFHSTFDKNPIKTTYDISELKNKIPLTDNNLVIASQMALTFPIPVINSRILFNKLLIQKKKISSSPKLQHFNKTKTNQLLLINSYVGISIEMLIDIDNFITNKKDTSVIIASFQSGVYILASFHILEFSMYKQDGFNQSLFLCLVNNALDKYNVYKLPFELFFWYNLLNKSSNQVTVVTDEITNNVKLGLMISNLKQKLLKQLFDYEEILEISPENDISDKHTLCCDIQTKLNISFFEKMMKLPDEVLFPIFNINKNEYSIETKLLCSYRLLKKFFNQSIAQQLFIEFTEKIGHNEKKGLFI